jgi:hypothetical protein
MPIEKIAFQTPAWNPLSLFVALLLIGQFSVAKVQTFASVPPVPQALIEPGKADAPPKVIALASGIGSQLQIVTQLTSVGTTRDPFDRVQMPMPN